MSSNSAMTTDQKVKLIREIAEHAFQDALEIRQNIEVMQGQNSGRINGNLSEAGAGGAAIVIRNALTARIAVLVARCYAPVKSDEDRHVQRAFDLLKDNAVRAQIAATAKVAVTIAEAEAAWLKCKSDNRSERLKEFRDKLTVHVGIHRSNILPLKYDEFFEFAAMTLEAIEKLAHCTGANTNRLNDWADELAGSAAEFWKPWLFSRKNERT